MSSASPSTPVSSKLQATMGLARANSFGGLPTPPHTNNISKTRREELKERRKSVEWAELPQIHEFSPNLSASTSASSSTAERQPKSILKPPKPLPPLAAEDIREVTPEPSNPLADPNYLRGPVALIIVPPTLRDLTRAYSVLTTRIRQAVVAGEKTRTPDTPRSIALFQPLIDNADAFAAAVVRDLGRSQPTSSPSEVALDVSVTPDKFLGGLPSPKESPKKKQGVSAEEVMHARDLYTVCQASLRFLHLTFALSTSEMESVFDDSHWQAMLDAALSIPQMPSLCTPNARKTYHLAIELILNQRLPETVLCQSGRTIQHSLRRAVKGELGKEGKKGSMGDGLRAIHHLSIYYPATFVPLMAKLLPAIFDALISPSLAVRIPAAQALGGIAYGLQQFDEENEATIIIKEEISHSAAAFLIDDAVSVKGKAKNTLVSDRTAIVKVLRTSISSVTADHPAQGWVWGLVVLAGFISLLGDAIPKNQKLINTIGELVKLGQESKGNAVRALTYAVYRPLVGVWGKWRRDMITKSQGRAHVKADKIAAESFDRLLAGVQTQKSHLGISLLGMLLGNGARDCSPTELADAMKITTALSQIKGESMMDAASLLVQLLPPPHRRQDIQDRHFQAVWDEAWTEKLFLYGLLAPPTTLFATDQKTVMPSIRGILQQCPSVGDVRPLSAHELKHEWVWDNLAKVWKNCIRVTPVQTPDGLPSHLRDSWDCLVHARFAASPDDNYQLTKLRNLCVNTLTDVLLEGFTHWELQKEALPSINGDIIFNHIMAINLSLIRDAWSIVCHYLPPHIVRGGATRLFNELVSKEHRWSADGKKETMSIREWAKLTMSVAMSSDPASVRTLWKGPNPNSRWPWSDLKKRLVWQSFASHCKETRASWEDEALILCLPFEEHASYELNGQDIVEWESLLEDACEQGAHEGIPKWKVLETVAMTLDKQSFVSMKCATQVADLLLSRYECSQREEFGLAEHLLALVQDLMVETYPPVENKLEAMWLVRSLMGTIENCPGELVLPMLEAVSEGACLWISDDKSAFTVEEFGRDIIPLYQHIIMSLNGLSLKAADVESLSSLLACALLDDGRQIQEAVDMFKEFWQHRCVDLTPPSDGWASELSYALRFLRPEEEDAASDDDMEVVPDSEVDFEGEEESDDDMDLLPRKKQPALFASPASAKSPAANKFWSQNVESAILATTSTKTPEVRKRKFPAPPCTNKVFGAPVPAVVTPTSPLLALGSLPTHSLLSAPRTEGSCADKENAAPEHVSASFAVQSAATPVALGKRKAVHDSSSFVTPSKKVRFNTTDNASTGGPIIFSRINDLLGSDDSIDLVEDEIMVDPNPTPQRSVLGAVAGNASSGFGIIAQMQQKQTLPRNSNVMTSPPRRQVALAHPPSPKNGRHRPSASSSIRTYVGKRTYVPAPIPIKGIGVPAAMVRLRSNQSSEASSDDDPRYGQVMAQHVESPLPRRTSFREAEPGSDDSTMADSPSQYRVNHQAGKYGSSSSGVPQRWHARAFKPLFPC